MPWHHIIPKHEWKRRFGNLKGANASDNLVNLTIEQHAQVHLRMADEGSEFDRLAYFGTSGHIGKEEVIRRAGILANTGNRYALGSKHPHSEETKRRISISLKGRKNPHSGISGVPLSEEHKKKISNSMMGKRKSDEFRRKMIGNQNARKNFRSALGESV